MLASSLINLKRFLKTLIEDEFQIFKSKLFHSVINAEKESLKNLCLILKHEILLL